MNIIFLSLYDFDSLNENNIYIDLINEFISNNHFVYIVSPIEKRKNKKATVIQGERYKIIKPIIGNITKTNSFEKLISTLLIGIKINGYIFRNIDTSVDLVLYTTPPITLLSTIKKIVKRFHSITYLLLKDIFPQNAVDLGLIKKTGFFNLFYKYFRNIEKELYKVSNRIGCMSQKNVDYILEHNKIQPNKIHINPNSINTRSIKTFFNDRLIREKYHLPTDKIIMVYGGNIGKPQGVDFLIKYLYETKDDSQIFNLVIGDGTEVYKLRNLNDKKMIKNFILLPNLDSNTFDDLIHACNIGMIFLDSRFSIPNFPSRILSYMKNKLPILAITDKVTDVRNLLQDHNIGYWSNFGDMNELLRNLEKIKKVDLSVLKENSFKYLINNFSTEKSYNIIRNSFKLQHNLD